MDELISKKRVRDESAESVTDSPEVKKLRDDLLCFLDDSDPDLVTQDLDSVMKSFEVEISAASSSSPVPVIDLTSDSADSQPDLGYLLEASDDELGLPPSTATVVSGEEVKSEDLGHDLTRLESDASGIGEVWGFEDQIPAYDSFGMRSGENAACYSFEAGVGDNYDGGNVGFDNLFEYSGVYFDSSDYSGFLPRPETLSAD